MNTGLLLIDIQRGFDSPVRGERNNPDAEDLAASLLGRWRETGQPVIHIRHVSIEPGSPLTPTDGGSEFKEQVMPLDGEQIFEKSVNSAFIGTGLEAYLRAKGISHLVLCGLTTPHCVSTSSRMAANLGFGVTLAHDACAAFTSNANSNWGTYPAMTAEAIHVSAVSHLHGEFVTARSTADILADIA